MIWTFQKYYGANKCLYTLERFDTNGFNPTVHNKYLVERGRQEQRHNDKRDNLLEFITQGSCWWRGKAGLMLFTFQAEDPEIKQKKFSWHSCIVETILITVLLGLIPGAVVTVEMIFSYGTQLIPDKCLEQLYSNSGLCRPLNGHVWYELAIFIPDLHKRGTLLNSRSHYIYYWCQIIARTLNPLFILRLISSVFCII